MLPALDDSLLCDQLIKVISNSSSAVRVLLKTSKCNTILRTRLMCSDVVLARMMYLNNHTFLG